MFHSILVLREHGEQNFEFLCEEDLRKWLPDIKYHEAKSSRDDMEATNLIRMFKYYISQDFSHIIINNPNDIEIQDNDIAESLKFYIGKYGLITSQEFLQKLHTDYKNKENLTFEIMQVFDIDKT